MLLSTVERAGSGFLFAVSVAMAIVIYGTSRENGLISGQATFYGESMKWWAVACHGEFGNPARLVPSSLGCSTIYVSYSALFKRYKASNTV